ncbi:hypothetical protein B484DRAFT_234809 [Ochromonadaceae sp. CCMP2298]|nr:hypothetical protein B484DRAFT_234809 [Ochromonadaceae sp. CCMP2298]
MDGGDKEHCKLTAASQHMQDLMLACAAYHDEVDLVEDLRQAQWTLHARGAIDDHAIALCVMDTNEGNVVYANKAFVELTGHNICAGLKVLAGKDTDSALQTELLEHISDSSPFKACLTHYTKSGRSFTDLVAIRPLAYPTGGTYCVYYAPYAEHSTLNNTNNFVTPTTE